MTITKMICALEQYRETYGDLEVIYNRRYDAEIESLSIDDCLRVDGEVVYRVNID